MCACEKIKHVSWERMITLQSVCLHYCLQVSNPTKELGEKRKEEKQLKFKMLGTQESNLWLFHQCQMTYTVIYSHGAITLQSKKQIENSNQPQQ